MLDKDYGNNCSTNCHTLKLHTINRPYDRCKSGHRGWCTDCSYCNFHFSLSWVQIWQAPWRKYESRSFRRGTRDFSFILSKHGWAFRWARTRTKLYACSGSRRGTQRNGIIVSRDSPVLTSLRRAHIRPVTPTHIPLQPLFILRTCTRNLLLFIQMSLYQPRIVTCMWPSQLLPRLVHCIPARANSVTQDLKNNYSGTFLMG